MKNYVLAAAIATAPMLAATSAHAITVDEGSQLTIDLIGNYAVVGGGPLGIGSNLTLSNVNTFGVSQTNPGGIDLDGLTTFLGAVGVSGGPLTLADGGGNSGLTFTLPTDSSATFTVDSSFGAFTTTSGNGASSLFGLGELANGSPPAEGSFSWSTSSLNPTGSFNLSFAVPPAIEEPEPDVIPLPAAAWMLLAGIGALFALRRRTHA